MGRTKKRKREVRFPKTAAPVVTRKEMQEESDRLFSIRIRTRDQWRCQKCGFGGIERRAQMECAHIAPRRFHAVRWADSNALTLCHDCHQGYTRKNWEWPVFLATLGISYEDRLREARIAPLPNVEDVLAALRAEVGEQD